MDRAWRFGRNVAGNAPRKAKLLEQAFHSFQVLGYVGVDLAIGAFHVRLCNNRRPAVARANDINHVEFAFSYDAVQVHVYEVQPGSCAPMTKKPWFDVLAFE